MLITAISDGGKKQKPFFCFEKPAAEQQKTCISIPYVTWEGKESSFSRANEVEIYRTLLKEPANVPCKKQKDALF